MLQCVAVCEACKVCCSVLQHVRHVKRDYKYLYMRHVAYGETTYIYICGYTFIRGTSFIERLHIYIYEATHL